MEVCRFYGSVSPGPNSHFYTVDTGECSALKALQLTTPATERRWNYEGSGFLSSAPVGQVCAPGTVPVYRAYNQGYARTIDSNHRIVANRAAIAEVVARGWVDEGVVMCAPPPGASDAPAKVFALMDPGDALDSARLVAYAARDNVDGLAVRLLWSSIESGDGRYNWTALDNALVAVRAQGKRITLHIAASDGAWPSWLPGIGAQTYTAGTPQGSFTDLVPWDEVYLARYARLMQAVASHLRELNADSVLYAVSVGAPVSEMSIRGCQGGQLGNLAYRRDRYLAAWQSSAAAVLAAFPGKPAWISAPVPVICQGDGDDGRAFYTALMGDLLSRSAQPAVFVADLNALGSQRMAQVDAAIAGRTLLGMQTIWSYSDDPGNRFRGTLDAALCYGQAAKAAYFEIYKADLDSTDPSVRSAIDRVRAGRACR